MSDELFLKPMPKTKDNPLGINVILCPICLEFTFYALTRTQAVKHFWKCYKQLSGSVSN